LAKKASALGLGSSVLRKASSAVMSASSWCVTCGMLSQLRDR
jgi:hypothetical protein